MNTHWHVLGAGAMGCLFAEVLHRAGCRVTLLPREQRAPGSPARVTVERDGELRELLLPTSAAGEASPITRLLVTTKAYDVLPAVGGIAHRLSADSEVLLLVNGMGMLEQLAADLPAPRWFAGTTTEGAYRIAPLHVRHAGAGVTRIGRHGQRRPAAWFACWQHALDDCRWDPDIHTALWHKLAINCAINPLTAVHRCRNGVLLQRPELSAELRALCAEIAAVSAAAGHAHIAASLWRDVRTVVAGTARNRSSMLQDVTAGRATEIEYITGYLLQMARLHRVQAPRNEALFRQLAREPCAP